MDTFTDYIIALTAYTLQTMASYYTPYQTTTAYTNTSSPKAPVAMQDPQRIMQEVGMTDRMRTYTATRKGVKSAFEVQLTSFHTCYG